MKMEVLAVQTQYGILGSNKVKDWTSSLTNSATPSTLSSKTNISNTNTNINSNNNNNSSNINNNNKTSINKTKSKMCNKRNLPTKQQINSFPYNTTHHSSTSSSSSSVSSVSSSMNTSTSSVSSSNNSSLPYTTKTSGANSTLRDLSNGINDNESGSAVTELSVRLLDELRAAKSRHLTCTEVSLPCDLTPCIAAEILRVSEKEPCGIRGCTIYIEFEDEPNNSRRIASLKIDPETVSTFEVYLTLRQDHRGWTSLLPQFMKSLARTITISPEFTITKHKLYSPQHHSSYNYNSNTGSSAVPIAAPTS